MADTVSSVAVRDPAAASRLRRQQMAELLMRQGMDTSPIQSPWQGVARLGQSLIGGLQSAQVQRETEDDRAQRDARRQAFLGQLLQGSAPAPQAPAAPPQMPAQPPMQPQAMPAAAPRGEAPAAVAQGIAARSALDPNAPDYEQRIMAINNGVVGQTMPGARPQPVAPMAPPPQAAPMPQPAPGGAPALDERTLLAMALSGDPELAQMAQGVAPFIARRERNQDQEADREWRRLEAARTQANADRNFALQQRQLTLSQEAARRAAEGATRGQIPQGQRLNARGELEDIPGYNPRTGLQPIQGYDEQGQPVVLFPDGRGGLSRGNAPPGVTLAPTTRDRNTGTEIQTVGPGGRVLGSTPIDIAGREAQERIGQQQGTETAAAPQAARTAEQSLAQIDAVLNHPALSIGTGLSGIAARRMPGMPAYDFGLRVQQLQGQAFLHAFESLKGGGAITEVEGNKATQAIARLDTAQSEEAFRAALGELRAVVEQARARALARSGAQPAAPAAAPQAAPQGTPPLPPGFEIVR